ncbi:hypothetical protein ACTXT7_014871 [Hymenolepis weldensis]
MDGDLWKEASKFIPEKTKSGWVSPHLLFRGIAGRSSAQLHFQEHMADQPTEGILSDNLIECVSYTQNLINELNQAIRNELLSVRQKYNNLCKHQYDLRAEIIAEIPDFWPTVLINHRVIRKIVTKDDKKVLAFLQAVEVQEFENPTSGYKINFYFHDNEWFTNHCITREYHFREKGKSVVYVPIIRWNKGMCLFDNGKDVSEDGFSNRSGFFSWLQFERKAVRDTIGNYIKEELWPNPLKYYLNPGPK